MGEALAGGAGIGGAWGEDAEPGVGGGKGVGSRLRLELQMAGKEESGWTGARWPQALAVPREPARG